jgi:DNA polymerase-3 subunit delta
LLYILTGQDDFSINQTLQRIKKEAGDPSILEAGTTALDGQQATLAQLRTACETVPFLGGKRLVLVRGLLERFEPRGRSRRQRRPAGADNQQNDYKLLSQCLNNVPDSTVLVLIEGRITGRNPLLKELAGKAEVKQFPLLKGSELRQWLQRRIAAEGGTISPEAVDLLVKLVGSNLWAMANEVAKLALFASGRRIEAEDVRELVSYAQEANVFAMVDAIVESRAEIAQQLLERMRQEGAAPTYLLFMLSRQLRMIVRARELKSQGKNRMEIQNRLGLVSDFALDKTLAQASRYSLARLKQVYDKLVEADLSIKTGRYSDELALNILVAELCGGGKDHATHYR